MVMMQRSADWVAQRKAHHKKQDDALLVDKIKAVIDEQGSYGDRRVWAVLKLQQEICLTISESIARCVTRESSFTAMATQVRRNADMIV